MTTVFVCSNPNCRAVWATDPQRHCPECTKLVEAGWAGWSTQPFTVRPTPPPDKCGKRCGPDEYCGFEKGHAGLCVSF